MKLLCGFINIYPGPPLWPRRLPGIVVEIYHAGGGLKSKICQDVGAGVIIDDSPEYIHDCHEAGIEVIVFGDYPWNQPDRLPENAPIARSWSDVEALLPKAGHYLTHG